MKRPPPIEIEEAEVERLIEQAEQGRLDAAAQKRIVPLLRTLLWLERTLLETRISVSKLKKILFGKRTEKSRRKPRDPPSGPAGGGQGTGETPPAETAQIQLIDKDIDHANGVIFGDVIIQSFGEKCALLAVLALDKVGHRRIHHGNNSIVPNHDFSHTLGRLRAP